MKKHLVILLLCAFSVGANAQLSVLTAGMRGGSSLYITDKPVQCGFGYQGLLDLGYSYLWPLARIEVGIHTGINVGYSASSFRGTFENEFVNTDYYGYKMNYLTRGAHDQWSQQIQVEIPIMGSLRTTGGFIMSLGAKLMMPVWNIYSQTITNGYIEAYYEALDTHIYNEIITGQLTPDQVCKGKNAVPNFNFLLGTEMGYEWHFDMHRVGLEFYFDIAPVSSHVKASEDPIVNVLPISDPKDPAAKVVVSPVTDYSANMRYIGCGLKFYYSFFFRDRHYFGWHDNTHQ